MNKIFFLLIVLCLVRTLEVDAQDFTAVKSGEPFKVTGSFFSAFNYTFNENSSIPPVGYNVGLNLNLNFFNVVNIPLSLAYSKYGTSINTLTLNRFGISPTYKTFKVHAGHRSYVLSPYIMSSLTVLGGGIEFSPEKFYFLAFYGKINDDYIRNSEFIEFRDSELELYKRDVYGVKFGFGKSSNRISLSAFHAKDNLKTGSIDSLAKYNIRGKENFALAAEMLQYLFNTVTFTGGGAVSILTNNIEGTEIQDSNATVWLRNTSFITTINSTTRYAFAYDTKISFRIGTFNLGFKYQHIDPFYSSLGVPFLQNNFDNYLVDVNGNLFKGKFNLFANFGWQYINANGYTGKPQKRVVGSANMNINFTRYLGFNLNYNNFVQNSTPSVEEVLDSLRVTINNKGWNSGLNYRIGKGKNRPHLISLRSSFNSFDVINGDETTLTNNNFNANVTYRYVVKDSWSIGGGLQYNNGFSDQLPSVKRYGLILNAGKVLTKGLNFKIMGSYRANRTNEAQDGYIVNGGTDLQYEYKKVHRLNISATQLLRKTNILSVKNETRFRINYLFTF